MNDYKTIELSLNDNTTTCVVHFSSRNRPKGKFCRYPVPQYVSNIYVNTGDRSWYLNGLSDLGETLDDSIRYFEKLINENGFTKVVCIGSSMGAFGAALFSSKLQAECICFGPELHLNILGGFSLQDGLPNFLEFDSIQPMKALLVPGVFCLTDTLISLQLDTMWSNTSTILLRNCGHGSARYLKDNNKLEYLIKSFIDNDEISISDLIPSHHIRANLNSFSLENITWEQLNAVYTAADEYFNSFQRLRLAELLTSRRVFPLAVLILTAFLDEHGPLAEAVFIKAKLLRRMRKHDEAISLFKTLESNPEFKMQGLWGQSMIHSKQGNQTESQRLYQLIIKEASGAPIVKEALKLSGT